MSTIDLIILGILLEKPMNAYEITHFVDAEQLDKILKISNPAIYKSCKRLFKSGYLDGETIREGELPEKVIYSVNNEGKEYFNHLMKHFSQKIRPYYLEFNSFLWNIDKLDKSDGLKMLENLKAELTQLKDWIIAHEKEVEGNLSFAEKMIVKQYRMVIITLVQWIKGTINEYRNNIREE